MKASCSATGCGNVAFRTGLCAKHYRAKLQVLNPKLCTLGWCDRGVHLGELCRVHYERRKKGLPMEAPILTEPPNRPPSKPCTIDGCGRKSHARGWCAPHYQAWFQKGDPLVYVGGPRQIKTCSVEQCTTRVKAKGLCNMHMLRMQRHGDVNFTARPAPRPAGRPECLVDGCTQEVNGLGRCAAHYQQFRKTPDYQPKPPTTGMVCTATGCTNVAAVRTFCFGHYTRERKYGDVLEHLPLRWQISPPPPCTVAGCERLQAGRTVCLVHYGQVAGWTLNNPAVSAFDDTEDWLAIIAGDPCSYCGDPVEHVDHIRPRSRGGADHWENFAPACGHCNQSKNATPLLHFLLRTPDHQGAETCANAKRGSAKPRTAPVNGVAGGPATGNLSAPPTEEAHHRP